jgi:hypothetical protein
MDGLKGRCEERSRARFGALGGCHTTGLIGDFDKTTLPWWARCPGKCRIAPFVDATGHPRRHRSNRDAIAQAATMRRPW